MERYLSVIFLLIATLLVGCNDQKGDYIAASTISANGFAGNAEKIRGLDGQEVKVWGFVDHGNLYGDEGAKAILGAWWGGDGPSATSWRFNLKAHAEDAVGHSFAVHVLNDPGRDNLLEAIVTDAKAGKPTQVFVTGRLFTFDAATNRTFLTGLYMEVRSSADILLELPEEKRQQ
ncbi:MAG: hypothetical protein KDE58_20440 [Caldilineaceae bacterium]|nr:hypothetical protein [Caldilineaceae bacterium]